MRALTLTARTTLFVHGLGMTTAFLDNDPIAFSLTWGGATLAGCALLVINTEKEKRMANSYRDVATRLRWELKEEYRPGDLLPSHRELAGRLGSNRTTVRRALTVLEAEGLVEVIHGKGTYVTGARASGRASMVENHIRSRIHQGQPVERADSLAVSWSVSPSTVRRVVSRLVDEGLIRRRRDGTYEAAK